jgi:hypothetical protein
LTFVRFRAPLQRRILTPTPGGYLRDQDEVHCDRLNFCPLLGGQQAGGGDDTLHLHCFVSLNSVGNYLFIPTAWGSTVEDFVAWTMPCHYRIKAVCAPALRVFVYLALETLLCWMFFDRSGRAIMLERSN